MTDQEWRDLLLPLVHVGLTPGEALLWAMTGLGPTHTVVMMAAAAEELRGPQEPDEYGQTAISAVDLLDVHLQHSDTDLAAGQILSLPAWWLRQQRGGFAPGAAVLARTFQVPLEEIDGADSAWADDDPWPVVVATSRLGLPRGSAASLEQLAVYALTGTRTDLLGQGAIQVSMRELGIVCDAGHWERVAAASMRVTGRAIEAARTDHAAEQRYTGDPFDLGWLQGWAALRFRLASLDPVVSAAVMESRVPLEVLRPQVAAGKPLLKAVREAIDAGLAVTRPAGTPVTPADVFRQALQKQSRNGVPSGRPVGPDDTA